MEPLLPAHQALLDDIRAIARRHLLQVRIELGHAIAHRLYDGSVEVLEDRLAHRQSGLKAFYEACADELRTLGADEALLRQSLTVWSVYVRVPERVKEALRLSHFVALAKVDDLQTRGILAEATLDNGWGVRQLEDAIRAVARGAWPDAAPGEPGLQPPAAPTPASPSEPPVDPKAPSPGRIVQRVESTVKGVVDVLVDFERVRVDAMSPKHRARALEAVRLVIERANAVEARLR